MLQQDLLDVTGHYDKNRQFVGTLGGQLLQLAFAIHGI